MAKIIQINTVVNNSTGRIMHDIQCEANAKGYETLAIVGRRFTYSDVPCVKYGNGLSFWMHVAITTVFDRHGFGSYFYTKKVINRLREENPNIIHLHNVHGYYLHISSLFKYLKDEYKGKVVWTLHDLWPITGHCPHYVAAKCDKWRTGCYKCPNKRLYPISLFIDNSRKNYADKKRLFTGFKNMTITVPSEWMASQVKQSYLEEYPVRVVSNGINLDTFDYNRKLDSDNAVLSKYNIPNDKKVLLGVASQWDYRKGLDDFIALSGELPEDYIIVLVGLKKNQIEKLPKNIIGILRNENLDELVDLYSSAHIFINPSLEESFSLVTAEALACGTPCIVLDTSAVKDLIDDDNGIVLHNHNTSDYLKAISSIGYRGYKRENIRKSAQKYSNYHMLESYNSLYEELL